MSRESQERRPSGDIGLPQSDAELALRIERARADQRVHAPKRIGRNAGTTETEIAGRGA